MIFGRWGTLGRFVLLTTVIGMLSGVLWYLVLIAVSGWGAAAEDLQIFPLFAAVGAGLGLLMGIPAYWTVRLCTTWVTSRAVSVLVFFALGAASVVVILVIVTIVTGSGMSELFAVSDAGDLVGLPLIATLGGFFTAAAAPLVLRPASEWLLGPAPDVPPRSPV